MNYQSSVKGENEHIFRYADFPANVLPYTLSQEAIRNCAPLKWKCKLRKGKPGHIGNKIPTMKSQGTPPVNGVGKPQTLQFRTRYSRQPGQTGTGYTPDRNSRRHFCRRKNWCSDTSWGFGDQLSLINFALVKNS